MKTDGLIAFIRFLYQMHTAESERYKTWGAEGLRFPGIGGPRVYSGMGRKSEPCGVHYSFPSVRFKEDIPQSSSEPMLEFCG
jgi:hypothetical protein